MRKTFTITFALILGLKGMGQDLHFSQFYDMPLLRNPGLSGIFSGQFQASTIYRNQWNSVSVPYQTMALGAEFKAFGAQNDDGDVNQTYSDKKPFVVTAGLQVLRDVAGTSRYTRTMYAPSLTFRVNFRNERETYWSTGFMGGPVTNGFNPNGLTWSDEYHNGTYTGVTQQPLPLTGKDYVDLALGTVFGSRNPEYMQWYIGAAAYHLPIFKAPTVGFGGTDILPMRYTLNAGLGLQPSQNNNNRLFFYGDANIQASQYEYLLGALYTLYFDYDSNTDDDGLSLGLFYRYKDAIVPTIRLAYYDWIIGLSYDFNISPLLPGSQSCGGPELMVKFRVFKGHDYKTACPRGRL